MRSKDPELKEKIVEFIDDFYADKGYSPSLSQIGSALGIGKTTAYRYVVKMAEEGMIDYDGQHISTSKIKDLNEETIRTAIYGEVPCGALQEKEENVEDYVNLPTAIFGNGDLFILRASGNSMIEAGINDGDLVVVKNQAIAENGDIIVALVNNQNTLKRFYRDEKNHKIILHPENSEMDDIVVDECFIQGVACNIIKNL